MGIGVSMFLLAAGAILTFAVETEAEGIVLHTVGVILMVIGGVGLVLSLLLWERIGGYGIRRRTVVERSDLYSDTHVVDRHDQLL